jgi:hypothetical protein
MDLRLGTYDGKVNIAVIVIMVLTLLAAGYMGVFAGGWGSTRDGVWVFTAMTLRGSILAALVYKIAHTLK